MHRSAFASSFVLIAITAAGGCSDGLKKENAGLLKDNEILRQQLAQREADLASQPTETITITEGPGPDASAFDGIEGVTTTVVGNEIHVSIAGDVLFDSGRDSLKPAAQKSLDAIASAIAREHGGKAIRVAGFTDTDPIKKSGYKSNYHLGFARAYAVREYLVGKGLEGPTISLSSYGPDAPLESKAKSRRVEVIVVGTT